MVRPATRRKPLNASKWMDLIARAVARCGEDAVERGIRDHWAGWTDAPRDPRRRTESPGGHAK